MNIYIYTVQCTFDRSFIHPFIHPSSFLSFFLYFIHSCNSCIHSLYSFRFNSFHVMSCHSSIHATLRCLHIHIVYTYVFICSIYIDMVETNSCQNLLKQKPDITYMNKWHTYAYILVYKTIYAETNQSVRSHFKEVPV